MSEIDINELLQIVGAKEVDAFLLRKQLGATQALLTETQARLAEAEKKLNAEG